jgi:hypothetical protein
MLYCLFFIIKKLSKYIIKVEYFIYFYESRLLRFNIKIIRFYEDFFLLNDDLIISNDIWPIYCRHLIYAIDKRLKFQIII